MYKLLYEKSEGEDVLEENEHITFLKGLNKTMCRTLDSDLQRLFLNTVMKVEVVDRQNSLILNDLQEFLGDCWAKEDILVEFTPFGSRISRLGGEESDLDISMSLFRLNYDTGARDYIPIRIDNRQNTSKAKHVHYNREKRAMSTSDILKTVRKQCNLHHAKFKCMMIIPKARVPIIKLEHVGTHVEVDICIENQLGVQNTLLLREYTRVDPRIHSLLLAIKLWAKNRYLNQSSQGTISTFSWCMMVIYFLHNALVPSLAPSFCLTSFGRQLLGSLSATNAYGTEHCHEPIFELDPLPCAPVVPITQRVTAGELLCGFFAFYGGDLPGGFDIEREVVNIRLNCRSFDAKIGQMVIELEEEREEDTAGESDVDGDERNLEVSMVSETIPIQVSINKSDAKEIKRNNSRGGGRNKGDQNMNWQIKILDPFVYMNLGRVVRSEIIQDFIQDELRRAFAIICERLSTDSLGSTLWATISECNALFHNGSFEKKIIGKARKALKIAASIAAKKEAATNAALTKVPAEGRKKSNHTVNNTEPSNALQTPLKTSRNSKKNNNSRKEKPTPIAIKDSATLPIPASMEKTNSVIPPPPSILNPMPVSLLKDGGAESAAKKEKRVMETHSSGRAQSAPDSIRKKGRSSNPPKESSPSVLAPNSHNLTPDAKTEKGKKQKEKKSPQQHRNALSKRTDIQISPVEAEVNLTTANLSDNKPIEMPSQPPQSAKAYQQEVKTEKAPKKKNNRPAYQKKETNKLVNGVAALQVLEHQKGDNENNRSEIVKSKQSKNHGDVDALSRQFAAVISLDQSTKLTRREKRALKKEEGLQMITAVANGTTVGGKMEQEF